MGWEKTRVCHRILWFNWLKDSELWNRKLWTNGITDIAVKPPGFWQPWPGWQVVTKLHSQVAVKPMTLFACLFNVCEKEKLVKLVFCFVPLAEWVMSPWIVGFERGRLCCGSSAIVRRCGVVAPCCLYDVDCMTYMMPANNYYLCACFFQSSRFIQGLVAIYLIGSVLWIDTAVSRLYQYHRD